MNALVFIIRVGGNQKLGAQEWRNKICRGKIMTSTTERLLFKEWWGGGEKLLLGAQEWLK
jgi:hypothetical protein